MWVLWMAISGAQADSWELVGFDAAEGTFATRVQLEEEADPMGAPWSWELRGVEIRSLATGELVTGWLEHEHFVDEEADPDTDAPGMDPTEVYPPAVKSWYATLKGGEVHSLDRFAPSASSPTSPDGAWKLEMRCTGPCDILEIQVRNPPDGLGFSMPNIGAYAMSDGDELLWDPDTSKPPSLDLWLMGPTEHHLWKVAPVDELPAMQTWSGRVSAWWAPGGGQVVLSVADTWIGGGYVDEGDRFVIRPVGPQVQLLLGKSAPPAALELAAGQLVEAGIHPAERGEASHPHEHTRVFVTDEQRALGERLVAALPGGATLAPLDWAAPFDAVVVVGSDAPTEAPPPPAPELQEAPVTPAPPAAEDQAEPASGGICGCVQGGGTSWVGLLLGGSLAWRRRRRR